MVNLMAAQRPVSHANDDLAAPSKEKPASVHGVAMAVRQDIECQLSSVAVPAGSAPGNILSRLASGDEALAKSEDEAAEPLPGELYMQNCAICNGGACPCSCGAITPA